MPGPVRFQLDEDGEHVWWYHHCAFVGIQEDGTIAGHLPLSDVDQTMLPNGVVAWTVTNRDPEHLTIVPSILCLGCGTHGFVTDGKWVSC